jgi:TP901 family phage tail tape measure protein
MIDAARLRVVVGADTGQAEKELKRFGSSLTQTAKNMGMLGTALSLGITTPLVMVGKQALTSAGNFEQSMNVLAQVTRAPASALRDLQAQALELGAVTSFSAGEAADAMLELGKAGMDATEISESIAGVLDLAAAGGVGLAQAAAVTAAALNTFGLEAGESARVANLLAAAANASAADITDLSQGLQQGGFAFAAAGQSIDDLVASLAILTNVGLTGSDAGTALKNAMMRLMAPTKEAAGLMQELGIHVYDAQGNMLPMVEIIGEFNEGLEGMTQQQRNAALETIFMSDGMKAMIPLLDSGVTGFGEMKEAVNQQGAAADVAAARMAGLSGAIEYLRGSVDSFLIGGAVPFLPMLADMTRMVADGITAFGELPAPILKASLAFAAVLAAAGPVIATIGALAGSIAFLLTPLGAVVVATAAMSAAFVAAGPEITAFGRYIAHVAEDGDTLNDWLTHLPSAVRPIAQAFGEVVLPIADFGRYLRSVAEDGDALNDWLTHLPAAIQPAAQAFGEGLITLQDLGRYLRSAVGDGDTLNDWLTRLPSAIQPATQAFGELIASFREVPALSSEMSDALLAGVRSIDFGSIRGQIVASLGLDKIDLSAVASGFSGLTEVEELIDRFVTRWTGAIGRVRDSLSGFSDMTPLNQMGAAVNSLLAVMGLIGETRWDVVGTVGPLLTGLATSLVGFAGQIVGMIDTGFIAKTLTGAAQTISTGIQKLVDPEKLGELGAALGGLAGTIVSKLGELFSTPSFGKDVGAAVGNAVVAIAEGAASLATGIANELANVNWAEFTDSTGQFVTGFISGVSGALANADYSGIGKALLDGIINAVFSILQSPARLLMGDSLTELEEYAPTRGDIGNWLKQQWNNIFGNWSFGGPGGGTGFSPFGTMGLLEIPVTPKIEPNALAELPPMPLPVEPTVLDAEAVARRDAMIANILGGQPMLQVPVEPYWEEGIGGSSALMPELQAQAEIVETVVAPGFKPVVEVEARVAWMSDADNLHLTDLQPTRAQPEAPKFDWPPLPEWTWPELPIFRWPELPVWTWPGIPRPSWLSEMVVPRPSWLGELLTWSPVVTVRQQAQTVPGQIGSNAEGTDYWRGGLTWVGERGPELVNLPRGSRVYSNEESMEMAGGIHVTVNVANINNGMDVKQVAYEVAKEIQWKTRGR